MLALIQFNLVSLLVAFLIGIVTGWWAFRHRRLMRHKDAILYAPLPENETDT